MYEPDAELPEHRLLHLLRHLGGITHLRQLLGGLDQRQHDKSLPTLAELIKN